jgi:hypothetical protein
MHDGLDADISILHAAGTFSHLRRTHLYHPASGRDDSHAVIENCCKGRRPNTPAW